MVPEVGYCAVITGKCRKIGLGIYLGVTLAQASENAREARNKITQGIDSLMKRTKPSVNRRVKRER